MKTKHKQKLILSLTGLLIFCLATSALPNEGDEKKEVTNICLLTPSDALQSQKIFDALSYDLHLILWTLSQERNKERKRKRELEENRIQFWIGMPNLRLKNTINKPLIGISDTIFVPSPPSQPVSSPKKEIPKKEIEELPPVLIERLD